MLKELIRDPDPETALSNKRFPWLSARNIDDVTLCNSEELTCWEMLNSRYLVIAKSDLEAWLSGPSSKTDKSGSRVRKAADATKGGDA